MLLQLREGRTLRSRTVNNTNNPEFNEAFKLVVDDVDTQVILVLCLECIFADCCCRHGQHHF